MDFYYYLTLAEIKKRMDQAEREMDLKQADFEQQRYQETQNRINELERRRIEQERQFVSHFEEGISPQRRAFHEGHFQEDLKRMAERKPKIVSKLMKRLSEGIN